MLPSTTICYCLNTPTTHQSDAPRKTYEKKGTESQLKDSTSAQVEAVPNDTLMEAPKGSEPLTALAAKHQQGCKASISSFLAVEQMKCRRQPAEETALR